jgi:hypothetical protein
MEKFVFLFSCFNLSPRDTYILTRWIQKVNNFLKKFFVFLKPIENTGFSGIFFKIVSKYWKPAASFKSLKPLKTLAFLETCWVSSIISGFYFKVSCKNRNKHYIVESRTVSIFSLFLRDFAGRYPKKVSEPIFRTPFRTQKFPTFNAHKNFPYIYTQEFPL